MRVIVVGYGVQGRKRLKVAGNDAVGVTDPVAPEANWRDLRDVPLDRYDAALVCTPDEPKIAILSHLLTNGKHALVEKPLHAASESEIEKLESIARRTGAVCYTAYNHRFEPHYVQMRDLLSAGTLGEKDNRKLVPTRWSITASDDTIGKHLVDEIHRHVARYITEAIDEDELHEALISLDLTPDEVEEIIETAADGEE